ncbi:hypothetical protein BDA99DRAFT_540748 [Phascolomyces articulosus]|uniref:SWIM-type domain-containing protein n=1 Tax=Phascolomyces articulosus TaxID=60185 RepID=A0AAD5K6U4_9FUNG|nr:hypothetical protein BDA99DRAFT_540748 [Phascolomyces articulosus]
MIVGHEDNIVKILSFTDPEKQTVYDVLVDVENYLVSCTCVDQQTNASLCKHMYLVRINKVFELVNRVLNISLIRPSQPQPQEQPHFGVILSDEAAPTTTEDLSQESLDRFVDSLEGLNIQIVIPIYSTNRINTNHM